MIVLRIYKDLSYSGAGNGKGLSEILDINDIDLDLSKNHYSVQLSFPGSSPRKMSASWQVPYTGTLDTGFIELIGIIHGYLDDDMKNPLLQVNNAKTLIPLGLIAKAILGREFTSSLKIKSKR